MSPNKPPPLTTGPEIEGRAEGWDEGYRQSIADLQAGYPYGDAPEWRTEGVEWLSGRLSDYRDEPEEGRTGVTPTYTLRRATRPPMVMRSHRYPRKLYAAAKAKAVEREENLSDVLREALERYVKGDV